VSFTIDEDGSNADGTLGSETLRNFNILLDTRTGQIHLRPNGNARALPNQPFSAHGWTQRRQAAQEG
jgi:hypothetical protein